MAFFFELFWLDIIPVGTFIPPVGLFSTVTSLTLIQLFGLNQPSEIAVVLTATIPFAAFMAWLEARQRLWQNREFNLLVVSTRRGNARLFAPQDYIRKGMGHSFVLHGLVCLAILVLLSLFLERLLPFVRISPWIVWPHLWLVASLGGVIAMRFRSAYLFMTGGIAVGALGLWAGFAL